MFLLSATATLRTIAVLLILWWLLRMYLRRQQVRSMQRPAGPQRPPGEVRIEKAPQRIDRDAGIIDAEYEEIK